MATVYARRNEQGKIYRIDEYQYDGSEAIDESHADVVEFRKPPLTAWHVRSECERRINAALGSPTVQGSMLREAAYLRQLASAGTALTQEQQSEVAMFMAINDWETAMVSKREELISNGTLSAAFSDATWPATPAGLSEFLIGF